MLERKFTKIGGQVVNGPKSEFRWVAAAVRVRPWRLVRRWAGLAIVLMLLAALPTGEACNEPLCQRRPPAGASAQVGLAMGAAVAKPAWHARFCHFLSTVVHLC